MIFDRKIEDFVDMQQSMLCAYDPYGLYELVLPHNPYAKAKIAQRLAGVGVKMEHIGNSFNTAGLDAKYMIWLQYMKRQRLRMQERQRESKDASSASREKTHGLVRIKNE